MGHRAPVHIQITHKRMEIAESLRVERSNEIAARYETMGHGSPMHIHATHKRLEIVERLSVKR